MSGKCTSCLIGFGFGSVLGLLFAPRTGNSTRRRISKTAKKTRRIVNEKSSAATAAMAHGLSRGVGAASRTVKRMAVPKRALAIFR
jgi:gas vesicle protein